ncbi:L-asparaginase [Streptomyces cinnamoneus]|uniref:L-asparaginase n=1 Tax=Streptomyces cinnamoneus TaxID=53446 RepID=A0A2G1XIP6_STRCJ|nr:asparaginase [Streptomyces cinnamoneus]PHQ51128.1 L-asparaginase [Streptomyces cinnamoneus]PPT13650.1 asparaginase [Streptomyces cinnamoneus]
MGVTLFALGGTISVSGGAADERLTGADIAAAVPGLGGLGVPLDVRDVRAVPSGSLTFADVLDVVQAASRAVADGADGIVVTQGTDTLEEAAFLVDLLWRHDAPFVLTGAMRQPAMAGADGPANVLAAVRVAVAPAARGLGALVAFNDEVHAARWTAKSHSTSTAAFVSPNAGPVGHVVEGRVRILARPERRALLPLDTDRTRLAATRVALHCATLDDDGTTHTSLADTHQGLVVAGFGVGHVPAHLAPVLGDLAARMPVVLTSRTGGGSVLSHTYRAPGSETDLLGRGLIDGGMLDPYKARVLLRLLCASGAERTRVAAAFVQHG